MIPLYTVQKQTKVNNMSLRMRTQVCKQKTKQENNIKVNVAVTSGEMEGDTLDEATKELPSTDCFIF